MRCRMKLKENEVADATSKTPQPSTSGKRVQKKSRRSEPLPKRKKLAEELDEKISEDEFDAQLNKMRTVQQNQKKKKTQLSKLPPVQLKKKEKAKISRTKTVSANRDDEDDSDDDEDETESEEGDEAEDSEDEGSDEDTEDEDSEDEDEEDGEDEDMSTEESDADNKDDDVNPNKESSSEEDEDDEEQDSDEENDSNGVDDDDDEDDDDEEDDKEEDSDDSDISDEEKEKPRKELKKKAKQSKGKEKQVKKVTIEAADMAKDLSSKVARDKKTLFLRNLPKSVTTDDIRALSSDIRHVRLQAFKSKSRKALNCAYLEFADEQTAVRNKRILEIMQLWDKGVSVDFVGEKSVFKPTAPQLGDSLDTKKLFVTGFGDDTKVTDLQNLFPWASSIDMPEYKKEKRPLGVAFIHFADEDTCKAAHNMTQGKLLRGSILSVMYAKLFKPRNKRSKAEFKSPQVLKETSSKGVAKNESENKPKEKKKLMKRKI